MATRSTISVQHKNGSVSSIYCHLDGYPSHHKPILLDYYANLEEAESLMSFGSLSVLAEKVSPALGDNHTFNSPQDDVCVYYGRDRGEDDTEPQVYDSIEHYNLSHDMEEYDYLFMEGKWWLNCKSNGLILLDKESN